MIPTRKLGLGHSAALRYSESLRRLGYTPVHRCVLSSYLDVSLCQTLLCRLRYGFRHLHRTLDQERNNHRHNSKAEAGQKDIVKGHRGGEAWPHYRTTRRLNNNRCYVRGEEDAGYRRSDRAADGPEHGVHSCGGAGLRLFNGLQDDVDHRREHEADADTHEDGPERHLGLGRTEQVVVIEAGSENGRTDEERQLRAAPRDDRAGDRSGDEHKGRRGREDLSRTEDIGAESDRRRVLHNVHDALKQHEHSESGYKRGDVRQEHVPLTEHGEIDHRVACAHLDDDERDDKHERQGQQADDEPRGPALRRSLRHRDEERDDSDRERYGARKIHA
jgi:hypothetical protein